MDDGDNFWGWDRATLLANTKVMIGDGTFPLHIRLARIEEKLDALIKALKAHGVGAWGE